MNKIGIILAGAAIALWAVYLGQHNSVPAPQTSAAPMLVHGCQHWKPTGRQVDHKYLWSGTGCEQGDPRFLLLIEGKEP